MEAAGALIRETAAACRASPSIETRGDRRTEAEDLLSFVLGRPIIANERVQGAELARFRRLVARRVAGEPLEYLTGSVTIRDFTLRVGPGAFIPRASSAFMADMAIERARDLRKPILVDVCTGVGPVALLSAGHSPAATVYGVDISTKAISLARRNARSHGISNVRFIQGDLFEPLPRKLEGHVDIVSAHPPYVARGEMRYVRHEMNYEPTEAITDSSKDGLRLIGRIVREAPTWLAGGGWLLIQVVDFRARPVAAMMRKAGFRQVRHLREPGEYDRVIAGRLPNSVP
jgi:release factor glutamine methyltransferase